MKKLNVAMILILLLAGCGGGGSNSLSVPPVNDPPPIDDDNNPPPPTTPVGSEQGDAVSAVIGADGGQLESTDGNVRVVIPAGALSADTTVSIQPISNEAAALGSIGQAFRIRPEGLRSNMPMTISFMPDSATLQGTALPFVSIGYQDSDGHWRRFENPQRDAATGTVSIQTDHFSDWSMLAGIQLRPSQATVKTGASQLLQIRTCNNDVAPEEPDDQLVPLLYACEDTPDATYGVGNWSVNGVAGGSADSGTVVADGDSATNKATFTAPDSVPASNPVAVSVEVLDRENPGEFTILASNIRIIEDANCESLKNFETIEAGVSFERFEWTASSENQAYDGNQSGRLTGTMINVIPAAARDLSPIGVWTSQNSEHTGLVTMDDTHQIFYDDQTVTETANGGGLPYSGMDVPSFITLTVDYGTCTYELATAFVVMGTVTTDGVGKEAPVAPGAIYYSEVIPDEFLITGELQREIQLPAQYDNGDKPNGYYPAGQNDELRAQGSTTGRWQFRIVP
jgi:hypothetical protein